MAIRAGSPGPRPEGPSEPPAFAYGSDFMVALLAALGVPWVAFNPGASFRGLHDSLVHRGAPGVVTCTHEEISVAVAHGFAKAAGRPMAAVLHDVVGLQHAAMAIYNAWCDRVPVYLLGGTGPMDVAKRRPWIDWIHTALVQGNLVRDFVKWDDQPHTLESVADSMLRAWRLMCTEPAGPVYVCLDAALQEDPVPPGVRLEVPDVGAYAPGAPPAPEPKALDQLAEALARARWPVIVADHTGRSDAAFLALAALAERWAIPVLDRGGRLNLPTTHPMNLTGDEAAVLGRADLVLALDVRDLFGTLSAVDRVARTTRPLVRDARVYAVGVQDYGVRSLTSDFQRLYPTTMSLLADTAVAVPALLDRLGDPAGTPHADGVAERRAEVAAWHRRLRAAWAEQARRAARERPLATSAVAAALARAVGPRPFVLANGNLEGWTHRLWALDQPRQYLGESGGGGLGYGIGAAIGAALAWRGRDRLVVDIQSDGDLLFTPGGLWTLAHHRLPVLIVMFNNRSYYNSEEHQANMARRRGRDASRAGVGTRIRDPEVDFAALARSMGVTGIGPVTEPEALDRALSDAVDEAAAGRPVLVDVVTQPR